MNISTESQTQTSHQYNLSPEVAFIFVIVLCILLFIGNMPTAVANPLIQRKNHKRMNQINEMVKLQTDLISSRIPPPQHI